MSIQQFARSTTVRMIVVGILGILLLIPVLFIRSLISEREQRYHDAVTEIGEKWGPSQDIFGPFLVVPVTVIEGYQNKKPVYASSYLYILPERMDVKGSMNPEKRKRGIYEAVLYETSLNFDVLFSLKNAGKKEKISSMDLKQAFLMISFPVRGVRKEIKVAQGSFQPGTNGSALFPSGVHFPVHADDKEKLHFQFTLDLSGNHYLKFTPSGKETAVNITSPYPDPKFEGAYLPAERNIGDKGFDANWKISHFSRNFSESFLDSDTNQKEEMRSSLFGVELIVPVDHYQKSDRATKYAVLFIFLTFGAFFLFEVFGKLTLHPLQYILVGFGMTIFYLLFLSLSEHIPFILSYIISATGVIAMIGGYSASILKAKKKAFYLSLELTGLYLYLFIVLQSQDYALLLGSIALFAVLGVVMYITRNIDWYRTGSTAVNS